MIYRVLLVTAAAVVYALIVAALVAQVYGKEGGDWSAVDPEVRAWIQSLHRPDIGDGKSASCCGEADAYFADMGVVGDDGQNYAIITDNRGNPLPVGTKLEIRKGSIQNTEGNPSGHVVVFASEGGHVFCFIPAGGV